MSTRRRNRKRKKYVTKAERMNYLRLLVVVMKGLVPESTTDTKGTP